MKIIKNREIVQDSLQHIADDAPIPANGEVTVSFQRWLAEGDAIGREVGVRVDGTSDIEEVVRHAGELRRICLTFPKFADGRCYSFARVLRDRAGFDGELRAIGDVLRDQLWNMHRCGIDAMEVSDHDIRDALHAFSEFSVSYQAAADGRPPIYRR